MKKLTSIFLSLVMIISLAACSQAPESPASSESSANSAVQTDSENTSSENSADSISDTSNSDSGSNTTANGNTNSNSQNANNGSNNSSSGSNTSTNGSTSSNNPNTNNGGNNNNQSSSNTSSDKGGNTTSKPTEDTSPKILVAYFSATGTTKGVAETAADVMGADIYEIVPEVPYTSADLNYNDNNSRSTKEMNDPNARPAINGSVSDMSQYDIVFTGYPFVGRGSENCQHLYGKL